MVAVEEEVTGCCICMQGNRTITEMHFLLGLFVQCSQPGVTGDAGFFCISPLMMVMVVLVHFRQGAQSRKNVMYGGRTTPNILETVSRLLFPAATDERSLETL